VPYTSDITLSIDDQDLDAWHEVCCDATDPYMQPGLIRAVQKAFCEEAQVWSVLIRDKSSRPVAAACICRYRIDAALLAGPKIKKVVDVIRRVFPGYLRFHVMFCGLPLTAGQSHVRFAPDVDRAAVVHALDDVLQRLSRETKSRIVIYKEFDDRECEAFDQLRERGYLKADSVPMNHLDVPFHSFEEYCSAMKSHYRYEVTRSLKKLDKAGLRVEHLHGAGLNSTAIQEVYTEEVHQLYLAVLERSPDVLEVVPASLALELARELHDDLYLMVIYDGDRVVAFGCGILAGSSFHPLYSGIDYSVSRKSDLYFNLFYKNIAHAIDCGATSIPLGQNAAKFKVRLGCRQQRRHFYIKVTGWLKIPFRLTAKLLFQRHELVEPQDVFKDTIAAGEPANAVH